MARSEQSPLAERNAPLAPDDHVVDEADPDELGRLPQTAREFQVVRRGSRIAGRMVVVEDHRRGILEESALQDLARLDDRAVDRAAITLEILQQAMPGVEEEDAGRFLRLARMAPLEIFGDPLRAREFLLPDRLDANAARELQRRREGDGLDAPEPARLHELADRERRKPAQTVG